jgi:uncharacterized protein YqjF (DUF2071 family)
VAEQVPNGTDPAETATDDGQIEIAIIPMSISAVRLTIMSFFVLNC